jgi:Bacterial SH3 domain
MHGDEKSTILKIDAIFFDDFKRQAHLSNGSVEAAEYKAIQDHLAAAELKRQEAREEEAREAQKLAAQELERQRKEQLLTDAVARRPEETLERLRHQLERLVKPGGTELRSAPFKSASSLKSLAEGARVMILIATPYWYGVETEDGQHGWIHHSQLEPLP